MCSRSSQPDCAAELADSSVTVQTLGPAVGPLLWHPQLPGVLAYGQTSDEAIAKAQALALRALADRLEHAEGTPEFLNIHFAAA